MTDGPDRVREGVLGAKPVPRLQVVEGGKSEKNATPPPREPKNRARGEGGGGRRRGGAASGEPTPESTCPLVPLGHRDGKFYFLDVVGQVRELGAKQMGGRPELAGLFLGDTSWLYKWFPRLKVTKTKVDGEESIETEVVGFQHGQSGERLMSMCRAAGLYGPHVVLREAGVWRGEDGVPVVHCGDQVLMGGEWRPAGFRTGNQVWVSGPPGPRPGKVDEQLAPDSADFAAPASVGQELQARLGDLWSFRLKGSEIVLLGLMGAGYYGAAARWRPNGYLFGGAGSGKSMALGLLRACVPAHFYSTDTTKSGIENAINGRPAWVCIDEAGDRADQRVARLLIDLVLSASSNDGTRGNRGTADGKGRAFQVITSVLMAAINPPDMESQHRDRITLVELVKPGAGEDHRAAMEAATAWAERQGPGLWGRALQGWKRWEEARDRFRAALGRSQCAAREMDQFGAILASWWVLVEDGVPTDAQALDGVGAVGEFTRTAADVAQEDGPRRVLQYLAGRDVQLERSTDRGSLGALVARGFSRDPETHPEGARGVLERYGIKLVRADDDRDRRTGKKVPRGGPGDGMWFVKTVAPLRELFADTSWDGTRWTYELARMPSAGLPEARGRNVRLNGAAPAPAIWLSRDDWDPPDPPET